MKRTNTPVLKPLGILLCSTAVTGNLYADDIETVTIVGQHTEQQLLAPVTLNNDASADFRDTFSRLPGATINSNGPVTAIAQYRGLFGDRINIKLDGAQLAGAGPNAMDAPLSHANSSHDTSLRLYRGIAPVSAGFETLGGAIVIESDSDGFNYQQDTKLRGNVSLQGQSNGDNRHYAGSVGISGQPAWLTISAHDQKGDNAEDGSDRILPNSFYDRDGYRFDGGFQSGDHQFTGSLSEQSTGPSGTAALAMDIEYIDATWYRLHYQYSPDNQQKLSVRLYGNENDHGMNNYQYRPGVMPGMQRLNTVDSDASGVEVNYQTVIGSVKADFGLDAYNREHNSRITNPSNPMFFINNFMRVSRDLLSGYAELSKPLKKAEMSFGARLTRVDSDAGVVSTSMQMMNPNAAMLADAFNNSERDISHSLLDLTLHYTTTEYDGLSWSVALAHKERAPSYTELYTWFPLGISAGLADGRNYLGNLSLEEEKADQIDVGLSYRSSKWQVSPRLFYQRVDNYIVGVPSDNMAATMITNMMNVAPPLVWTNTDAELFGVDILASYQLTSTLSLDGSFGYTRGQRKDINDELYRLAPANLNISLNWMDMSWYGKLESVLHASQDNVASQQQETSTAGYGIVNVQLGYKWSNGLDASLMVNNIFNKTYTDHMAGVNRVRNADVPVGERLPGQGINVAATLSYRF